MNLQSRFQKKKNASMNPMIIEVAIINIDGLTERDVIKGENFL